MIFKSSRISYENERELYTKNISRAKNKVFRKTETVFKLQFNNVSVKCVLTKKKCIMCSRLLYFVASSKL